MLDLKVSLREAPGGATIGLEWETAAQNLAYFYATSKGEEPAAAAQRAVQVMIGKYKFHNSSHYGARSPADLDRDPEEYAALVVKNIQAHQLADVPDDVLTPDEARSAYVDSLGGSHKWISNRPMMAGS